MSFSKVPMIKVLSHQWPALVTIFSTCSILIAKLSTEIFYLSCRDFHFQDFIFSWFLCLYWILLSWPALSSLFLSAFCLNTIWVQLVVHLYPLICLYIFSLILLIILINLKKISCLKILLPYHSKFFIVELWTFEGGMLTYFPWNFCFMHLGLNFKLEASIFSVLLLRISLKIIFSLVVAGFCCIVLTLDWSVVA